MAFIILCKTIFRSIFMAL